MTMNNGLTSIQLSRLAGVSEGLSIWTETSAVRYFRPGYVWMAAVVIAGVGIWMLFSGYGSDPAEIGSAPLAAVSSEPVADPAQRESWAIPPVTPLEDVPPAAIEAAPVEGLRIASQSWRRGGLGSKALITFTLRNGNEYAVKDIEIACAFARRDGSHLTDRKRLIPETVAMKSRKTFARLHVGFVNVNASRAKCSLVTASRA